MTRRPIRPATATETRRTRLVLVVVVLCAALTATFLLLTRGGEGTPSEESESPAISASSRRSRDVADVPEPSSKARAARAAAPPVVRSVPGAPGVLEGDVRSRKGGAAVPNAELSFEVDGVLRSVRSDAEGRYRLETTKPGHYRLVAIAAEGFLPHAPAWGESVLRVQLAPGAHVTGATLWLSPAEPFTGLVLDEARKPVAGATVRLYAAASDAALMPLEDRFESDAAGTFTFQAPPFSVLEARKKGAGVGRARLEFGVEISKKLVIQLSRTLEQARSELEIRGQVVGPDGAPVEGAVVEAHAEAAPFEEAVRIPSVAASDDDGEFVLDALSPGSYRVVAAHAELSRAEEAGVKAGAHGVVLKLGAGGRLALQVRDESGRPLSAFRAEVWQKAAPLRVELVRARAVVTPDGTTELGGLPEGELEVEVEAPGYAPSGKRPVSIFAQGAASMKVVLGRGQTLRGRVSDAASKAPLAGARVAFDERSLGDDPLQHGGETDGSGQFTLSGVRPGAVTLQVSAPGHHARLLAPVVVLPGQDPAPVEVSLRPLEKDETPQVELAGLGLVLAPHEDALAVGAVAPAGGGAAAGIVVGDAIVSVDGRSVVAMGFPAAIKALRGPENSTVSLGVRREGHVIDVLAQRRIVRM